MEFPLLHLAMTTAFLVVCNTYAHFNAIDLGMLILSLGIGLHQGHMSGHRDGMIKALLPDQCLTWWYGIHGIGHHQIMYPYRRFVQPAYHTFQSWSDGGEIMIYSLHVIIVATIVIFARPKILSWTLMQWSIVIAYLLFTIMVEDYFHRHIHLQGSWWEQFSAFRRLRRYHLKHHTRPHTTNFAIVALWVDMLMGTFSA